MSLREQLAAKTRRRLRVTVQLSNPGEDLARVLGLRQLAEVDQPGLAERTPEQAAADAAALADAEAALAAHYADVELVSMPAADFEAVVAAHPGTDPKADQGMDWHAALPVLLAASVVEEDLADEAWWRQQLAEPTWTHGELLGLWQAVLAVNARVPRARPGKG